VAHLGRKPRKAHPSQAGRPPDPHPRIPLPIPLSISSLLLSLPLTAAAAAPAQGVVYQVQEIQAPFGKLVTTAASISNEGWITGTTWDPGGPPGVTLAFVYDGSTYSLLAPLPGATVAAPSQVLGNGRVLGASGVTPPLQGRPVVWQGGLLRELRRPSGHTHCIALRGNGLGTIVGYSLEGSTANLRPVFWQNGILVQVPLPPGASGGLLFDVNNAGQMLGYWSIPGNPPTQQAFLLESGKVTPIGTLGGDSTILTRINDAGQAVGRSDDASGASHGVVFANGVLTKVPLLPGYSQAFPSDINRRGLVVGFQGPPSTPFLFDGENVIALQTVLDPITGAGWTLINAEAINARGQIVGQGQSPAGQPVSYLLTPVETPTD
jgi:uncharacterized membrane protein